MNKLNITFSFIIGILLIVSGTTKLLSIEEFIEIVQSYKLVPGHIARISSVFLIFLEIILGISLFFQRTRKKGAEVTLILFSFFMILSIFYTIKGMNIECGCFGDMSGRIGDEKHFMLLFCI